MSCHYACSLGQGKTCRLCSCPVWCMLPPMSLLLIDDGCLDKNNWLFIAIEVVCCSTMCCMCAGVHVTLPDYYSPEHLGMIVPKTKDGRVVFMLPWLDATIAGTTGPPHLPPSTTAFASPHQICVCLLTLILLHHQDLVGLMSP